MFINALLILAGLVLLKFSADFLVHGAVSIAKHVRVPVSVIGMTIVAFGTSMPELAIVVSSSASGNTDIGAGNIVGSSIINILLILGISAVIKPLHTKNSVLSKELPILLLITVAFSVMFMDSLTDGSGENVLTRSDGMILVLIFLIFVYYLITIIRRHRVVQHKRDVDAKYGKVLSLVAIISGTAGVIVGANLVVDNAIDVAELLNISQKIIALTIVTIGTSLPEIAITVSAAQKGEPSLAIGNIIGTNIFNICIALGLPVVIFGAMSMNAFTLVDCVFMIMAVVFLWVCLMTQRTISRKEGVFFLAVFVLYYILLFAL